MPVEETKFKAITDYLRQYDFKFEVYPNAEGESILEITSPVNPEQQVVIDGICTTNGIDKKTTYSGF
jgi:hypothetical protein